MSEPCMREFFFFFFFHSCSSYNIYVSYLGCHVEWPEADGASGPLGYDAVAATTAAAHNDDAVEGVTELPGWDSCPS